MFSPTGKMPACRLEKIPNSLRIKAKPVGLATLIALVVRANNSEIIA